MIYKKTSNQILSQVLLDSFQNWGSRDKKFNPLYKKLTSEAFVVINAALTEVSDPKPSTYEFWWANEHMRFKSLLKDSQMRLVHELMYNFLTKVARGTLKKDIEKNETINFGKSEKSETRKKTKRSA